MQYGLVFLVCRSPLQLKGGVWCAAGGAARSCADLGRHQNSSGTGTVSDTRRAGVTQPCRTGQESPLLGFPPELGAAIPQPRAAGDTGQVKGTEPHPWSCHALGSVLCSCRHPRGQTSPVSIQHFVFPGWRERQMSLGLAGQLFVFEIPNRAELSSAWAQLREGCWGSPSDLTGDTAGDTCAPCQFLGSFTGIEGNQSTETPCSRS